MLTRESLPFHSYGGMQRYVWCLAQYLARQRVKIEVILPPAYAQVTLPLNDNIKFKFIGPTVRRPFFWTRYFLFSFRASRYLTKKNFDILHGFEICPFFYLLKKKRKPVVIQTFGNEPLKTEGIKRIFHRIRWVPFFKSVVRRANFIGSIGQKQTEELVELYDIPEEKIFDLPDGIELEKISILTSNLTKTRRDLGLDESDVVLICVSRLVVNKGIQYLIQAMDILARRLRNIKLILVGSGPEEKTLKDMVEKFNLTDRIRHFKDINDQELFEYYRLADIFVLPTLYEGLPLVLLEAAACGLPIITTDITDNSQIVKNGKNGYLVSPKNAIALADAIIKMYDNNLVGKMSQESKELAQNYDWSNVARKALNKYEDILAKKS